MSESNGNIANGNGNIANGNGSIANGNGTTELNGSATKVSFSPANDITTNSRNIFFLGGRILGFPDAQSLSIN